MDAAEVVTFIRQFADEIVREPDLNIRAGLLVAWRDTHEAAFADALGLTVYRLRVDAEQSTDQIAERLGLERHYVGNVGAAYASAHGLASPRRRSPPDVSSMIVGPGWGDR